MVLTQQSPPDVKTFFVGLLAWLSLLAAGFFFIFQFNLNEVLLGSLISSSILYGLHRVLCPAPPGTNARFSWLGTICYIPTATGSLLLGMPERVLAFATVILDRRNALVSVR